MAIEFLPSDISSPRISHFHLLASKNQIRPWSPNSLYSVPLYAHEWQWDSLYTAFVLLAWHLHALFVISENQKRAEGRAQPTSCEHVPPHRVSAFDSLLSTFPRVSLANGVRCFRARATPVYSDFSDLQIWWHPRQLAVTSYQSQSQSPSPTDSAYAFPVASSHLISGLRNAQLVGILKSAAPSARATQT